jgi:hypothetical protein
MRNLLIIIFTTFSTFLYAHYDNNPKVVEEMHVRKWQYIVENAKLTSQEAAVAQPIFMEYEKAVWKLMEKNKPAFLKKKKEGDQPNFDELNNSYVNTEIQKAQLLKSYYQKLRKVISAETIFRMGKAERAFRNELIRNWQENRNNRR